LLHDVIRNAASAQSVGSAEQAGSIRAVRDSRTRSWKRFDLANRNRVSDAAAARKKKSSELVQVVLDPMEAAKLANADEFISRMPNGYHSLVGDRGSTLSGGQRQRIGIARALIRNNPILILDEPTAALDAESEHLVIQALERLMAGRTVITIAHRLSTLRDAHKIIVVKDGVVVEDGTQEELLKLDGVYAELHHLQFDQPA